jgi:multidrug efflux pump subunit AcrB
MTSKEIIEELEQECRKMSNVKLEFYEPPAVPGFGAAGGFSLNLLDKTNSGNYAEMEKIIDEFMEALAKRKELKGLFTFFANTYSQYELVIDNDVAMQKGVSIADALNNLSIVVGSTWEQGFVRIGQFFKVYAQAAPEFRRLPEDFENMFVKKREEPLPQALTAPTSPQAEPLPPIPEVQLQNPIDSRAVDSRGDAANSAIETFQP